MEENVALDSKKQKKFVKSIRGIKKLIKKNEEKAETPKKDAKEKPVKPFSMKLKDGKIKKWKKRKERGLVYLSHIPHGFYEHQMTQYFKQFGVVTNVRVIRSKRTGNSKGFAFVEFKEPAVGQIVAETMNNYLMGKRLIKAAYVPPEKQKYNAFRKNWNSVNNPASKSRLKLKKEFNAVKDENGELKKARKLLSTITKNKKKLSELGINYDFTPVDIPEALLNTVIKKEKDDNDMTEENKPKKAKKEKQEKKEDNIEVKNDKVQKNKQSVNEAKGKKKNEKEIKVTEVDKNGKGKKENVLKVSKEKVPVKVNENLQKEKEQKLKSAGVKPAEFIKVGEESEDDSDGSYDFDSDEFEKMLEEENVSDLSGESDVDSGDDDESNEESDEKEVPQKKVKKGKSTPQVVQPVHAKKQVQKQQQPKQQVKKQKQKKPSPDNKRKIPQKTSPASIQPSSKPKFEKQSQKPMKKQFKKK